MGRQSLESVYGICRVIFSLSEIESPPRTGLVKEASDSVPQSQVLFAPHVLPVDIFWGSSGLWLPNRTGEKGHAVAELAYTLFPFGQMCWLLLGWPIHISGLIISLHRLVVKRQASASLFTQVIKHYQVLLTRSVSRKVSHIFKPFQSIISSVTCAASGFQEGESSHCL